MYGHQVKDVANEVSKMQTELKTAELSRQQFNSREAIFGKEVCVYIHMHMHMHTHTHMHTGTRTPRSGRRRGEAAPRSRRLPRRTGGPWLRAHARLRPPPRAQVTDYAQLAAMSKKFEPYATLWLTASTWVKNQTEWNEGQFSTLDPETMEKELANAQRNMYKLSKTFSDTAGLGEIAMQIKGEVEEFMPVMPLVTALRNPGMRERHWTEMTAATGKDLSQAG